MNTSFHTYLVTQTPPADSRSTVDVVDAAIRGGIDVVQLREKHTTARRRYDVGREIRERTRDADVPFLVNDRVDLAVALDADGVHLGDDDLPVAVARDMLGDDAIVGRSVNSVEAAVEAERAGADYLGAGAVFATDTKDVERVIGTDTLADIDEAVDIPVVGIGGIDAENAGDVTGAGADGVAVVSAITAADDPASATRDLRQAVAAGSPEGEVVDQ
ncbi:MAG: thiamine phosphate synthase [Halanaeroarchaeum sp.]